MEGKLKIDVRLYRRTGKKGKKSTINKTFFLKKIPGDRTVHFPSPKETRKKGPEINGLWRGPLLCRIPPFCLLIFIFLLLFSGDTKIRDDVDVDVDVLLRNGSPP